jgi:hypothetical protein
MLMNTKLRIANTLLVTLLLCSLVACTTQEAPPAGTGGSGGTAVGGSGGTTPAGGAGGATTAATTGGTGANNGTPCLPPGGALITDFTYAVSDGSAPVTTEAHFGNSTTLEGSEYVYPGAGTSFPLTSDVTQSNWHITGTVGDYSGFGVVWYSCSVVDASAYKGIQFMVSGTIGNTSPMTLGVSTLNSAITAEWIAAHNGSSTDPGRCVPISGTSQYYEQGCADPVKDFTVSATPTQVKVLWSEFAGGSPDAYVKTPNEITHIYWRLPWSGSGSATYPVDIVIDDLSFIP